VYVSSIRGAYNACCICSAAAAAADDDNAIPQVGAQKVERTYFALTEQHPLDLAQHPQFSVQNTLVSGKFYR